VLWATVPLERLTLPLPAVAVTVPLHVLLTLGVPATTKVPVADGSVSLKATPVRSPAAVVFGLMIVKVSLVVPFNGMAVTVAVPPLELARPAAAV
jgi:hypothetical protein